MPADAAPAYRSGETRSQEVVVMLVMEAERFGGPQVLTARQVPDPAAVRSR